MAHDAPRRRADSRPRGGHGEAGGVPPPQALVFIGRFQPFHAGHLGVVLQALERAAFLILIVGSSFGSRSPRNAFTFDQIERMIRLSLPQTLRSRVLIRGVPDFYNDARWIEGVQSAVEEACSGNGIDPSRVGLIGFRKDESSYYLSKFPRWRPAVEARPLPGMADAPLSATEIREAWLDSPETAERSFSSLMPDGTRALLRELAGDPIWQWLREEAAQYRKLRDAWRDAPHPPTLMTSEAVVVQAGHVLLNRRDARPGLGLLSLPGDYVGQFDTFRDTVIRSLLKKSRLKMSETVLEGRCRRTEMFDNPWRSERGRVVSQAVLIALANHPSGLPEIGTSGLRTAWYAIAGLRREDFFEDHYLVMRTMIDSVGPGDA